MTLFSDYTLDTIRDRTNIKALIAQNVELKKVGRQEIGS